MVQTEQQNARHHRIFLDSNKCRFLQQTGSERPNKLFIGLSVLLLLKQKSWGFPYRLVISVWRGEVSLLCKAGRLSRSLQYGERGAGRSSFLELMLLSSLVGHNEKTIRVAPKTREQFVRMQILKEKSVNTVESMISEKRKT